MRVLVSEDTFGPSHIVVVDPAKSRRTAASTLGADVLLDPADDTQFPPPREAVR